jgi:hypothetical protein
VARRNDLRSSLPFVTFFQAFWLLICIEPVRNVACFASCVLMYSLCSMLNRHPHRKSMAMPRVGSCYNLLEQMNCLEILSASFVCRIPTSGIRVWWRELI